MVWLLAILLVVILVGGGVLIRYKSFLGPHSEILEVSWTLLPMLILISIAFPSIRLLCIQDALCQAPGETIKVVSNQWNWQSDFVCDIYDHLLDIEGLEVTRSLEVPLVITTGTTRVLLTSSDVLHSLGIPSLGIKLDATPGRLNATIIEAFIPGVLLGSCFELCGSGHRIIPIRISIL